MKSQNAIVIRSPMDIKLKPRTSAWVDTDFKIDFDEKKLSSWMSPSTTFKSLGLSISDETNWHLNKTKNDTICIHLKNISFYYDIKVKKGNIIALIFFNGSFSEIKYKQY